MDDKKLRFIGLAQKYEEQKNALKALREELAQAMTELGVETYHQDLNDGTVYKIYKPEGTFVEFKTIDFKRTAKEGERGGTVLSKSEAMSMGYVIPGKK